MAGDPFHFYKLPFLHENLQIINFYFKWNFLLLYMNFKQVRRDEMQDSDEPGAYKNSSKII